MVRSGRSGRIHLFTAAAAVLVGAGSSTALVRGEDLVLLSAVGMRQVMLAVAPTFELETGHRLAVAFDSGAVIARRVRAGKGADFVIIPRPAIDDLVRAGAVEATSVLDVARSSVGLAVRKGVGKPDISSTQALRRVLLAAKSIARPDPALGGASGVHIAQVLERLGIAEELRSRTILASHPDREHEMPGSYVAAGRAEIALHQIQELLAVPDIEVVGALPGDLAGSFLFSAGILTTSPRQKAGRQLLEVLQRPETRALIKSKGMEAVVAATLPDASTVKVDCNTGGTIRAAIGQLKPRDLLLVQGTCRENVVIHSEIDGITIDGQGKATIIAIDARQPAIQVLGREVTIKGFTVTGGFFGIAVNRGGTATIDGTTIEGAAHSGVEVSQNSFGRVINSTIRRNRQNGILVLGSASAHIGVLRSDDEPAPNVIQENESDGIQVIRASTARIIGNTLRGNRGNGLTVQQTSHADVAGNVFDANGKHGIHVIGNSGINLADSGMRLFERANTTTTPNGLFGIRCELGAYLDGTVGSLTGKSGVKHVSDSTCTDRSTR